RAQPIGLRVRAADGVHEQTTGAPNRDVVSSYRAAVCASQLQSRQGGGLVRRARGPMGSRPRVPPTVRQTARERRCGPMNRMNLLLLLDRLEQMVQEAPRMPIGHRVLMNAHEMLDMIHKIRESLPEEVRRA